MEGQLKTKLLQKHSSKEMGGVFIKTDDDSILQGLHLTFKDRLSTSQIHSLFKYFEALPEKYSFANLATRFVPAGSNNLEIHCQIEDGKLGGKTNWKAAIVKIDTNTL